MRSITRWSNFVDDKLTVSVLLLSAKMGFYLITGRFCNRAIISQVLQKGLVVLVRSLLDVFYRLNRHLCLPDHRLLGVLGKEQHEIRQFGTAQLA